MDSYIEKAARTLYSYRPNKRVVANSHAVARSAGIPLRQEIGFTPRDIQISLEALQFFQAEGILKYKQEVDDTAKYMLDFSLMFKIDIVHTVIEDIDYVKLENFLPKVSKFPFEKENPTQRKICFNKENGEVWMGTKLLGTISPNNREFFLFEFLYDSVNEFKSCEEIITHIKQKTKTIDEKTASKPNSYCSGIKRRLPPKIQRYIESKHNMLKFSEKPNIVPRKIKAEK